nr:hypothetical protein [uncultured Dethiosulfovibrio sp.]
MSVGSIDNTVQQQNPYANKAVKPQDQEAEGKVEGTGKTEPSKPSQPKGSQDEYIPSSDNQEKASGVYRLEKDENGNQKVTVDRPATMGKETEEQIDSSAKNEESSETAEGSQKSESKPTKSGGAPKNDDGETSSTTTNTDSVDTEVEKLKKRRTQLQKQLQDAQGDENQRKNIEKQLAQLDAEITLKDSDAYRKQNATYTA